MKLNLNINPQTDLLIVDDGYSGFIPKNCKFSYLKKEIYLFYLFKSILESLWTKQISKEDIKKIYFKNLIQSFAPQIVFGHDLDGIIFRVKKNLPKITTIAYQLGSLFKGEDEVLYKKILQNHSVDYFCVFNKNFKYFLKKIIKTKVFITGSVKNNSRPLINKKTKYDFVFISQFKPRPQKNRKKITHRNNEMKKMKQIVSCVYKYCIKNNKTLTIALSSIREDKKRYNYFDEEINFFESISKDIIFHTDKSSLQAISLSKVVICYNSNLGAEILAQGKKIIFFSVSKYSNFLFDKKRNIYDINKLEQKIINIKLKKILYLSDLSWKKYINKIQLINFDLNNKILNKLIYKILREKKNEK